MKKTNKTKAIALAFVTGILLTGCTDPKKEEPQEVYGPPINNSTEVKVENKTEDITTEEYRTLYGIPDSQLEDNTTTTKSTYDPTTEEPEDVYGPPVSN